MKNNSRYKILSPEGFVNFDGIQKLSKKTREIIFDNNITLRCSYNHKIFNYDGEEIIVKDIKIKDRIKSHNGFLDVINIIDYDYESDVYDIINSGNQNLYYTNDIISHNCNFLGSGDNVFDSKTLTKIRENTISEPTNKMMANSLWIWKEPVIGHKYIMGIDVSRGDSEDYSTFQIIDFDEREQVAEYVGKIPPDIMADIAFKWANMYSCFVVIDITGGMGVSTARKMQELGYRDLYVDGVDYQNKWKYDPKQNEKIPGINFNSKRVQIIAAFEEAVRHNFIIHSNRLLNEMNTFVYVGGRPDHQKGQHDDLLMSVAMAIYVGESSFSQLGKVTEHTKAMLESWTVNVDESPAKSIAFNPGSPNLQQRYQDQRQQGASRQDYIDYGWLFGGKR
jgi:hypothetical protein